MKKKKNYESNKEQILQKKMSMNVAVLFRNGIFQDI
jgi:hypothetical protein